MSNHFGILILLFGFGLVGGLLDPYNWIEDTLIHIRSKEVVSSESLHIFKTKKEINALRAIYFITSARRWNLTLDRRHALSTQPFSVTSIGPNGTKSSIINVEDTYHYTGHVTGEPDSSVYITFDEKSKGIHAKIVMGSEISVFHRLNALYKPVKFAFSDALEQSGYGFLLKDIFIHESWNLQPGHYNARTDIRGKAWSAYNLLDSFNYAEFNQTCLAHLLTYRAFNGYLRGLSWTATPEKGGICSPAEIKNSRKFHTNTGLTTFLASKDRRLSYAHAELILAHELGHNWGAAHDPDTHECSPSAENRGKYLMYTRSVTGSEENNFKFSPCSRRTIGETLANRASRCFVRALKESQILCGNGRLDPGEECDAGRERKQPCCTSQCLLRGKAKCSPWNHDCCTKDCQIAPASTSCADRTFINRCYSVGKCNGRSSICSGPTLLSGVPCAEHGMCVHGRCQTMCARYGLNTCICDAEKQSCFICCLFRPSYRESPVCRPLKLQLNGTTSDPEPGAYTLLSDATDDEDKSGYLTDRNNNLGWSRPGRRQSDRFAKVNLHLDDYQPCITGFCMKGECQRSNQQSILRSTSAHVTYAGAMDYIREFMIVWVIAFSLTIWIPIAYRPQCVITMKQRLKLRIHGERKKVDREELSAVRSLLKHTEEESTRPQMTTDETKWVIIMGDLLDAHGGAASRGQSTRKHSSPDSYPDESATAEETDSATEVTASEWESEQHSEIQEESIDE